LEPQKNQKSLNPENCRKLKEKHSTWEKTSTIYEAVSIAKKLLREAQNCCSQGFVLSLHFSDFNVCFFY